MGVENHEEGLYLTRTEEGRGQTALEHHAGYDHVSRTTEEDGELNFLIAPSFINAGDKMEITLEATTDNEGFYLNYDGVGDPGPFQQNVWFDSPEDKGFIKQTIVLENMRFDSPWGYHFRLMNGGNYKKIWLREIQVKNLSR